MRADWTKFCALKDALQKIFDYQDVHSSGCGKIFGLPFRDKVDEYGCNCGTSDHPVFRMAAKALKSSEDTQGG